MNDKTKWYSIKIDELEALKNPIGSKCTNVKNVDISTDVPLDQNDPTIIRE